MLSTKEKENALNEVRILASIDSPYIVQYKEAFFDEESNCLCVIMVNKIIYNFQKINFTFTIYKLQILIAL